MTAARGRVALYGEFGTQNLGNEATLQVTIDQLRERLPDAELVVVGVHPEAVTAEHGVPSFAMTAPRLPERRLRGVAAILNRLTKKLADAVWLAYRLKGFDALVVAGTGIVEDFRTLRAWQTSWSLLSTVAAARLNGAAVVFSAVGVSPPTSAAKRWMLGTALRLGTYRSYRDAFSRDAATRMGVDTTADALTPDVCFALEHPPTVDQPSGSPARIGLGVMAFEGDDPDPGVRAQTRQRYVAELTSFAAHFVAQGHPVVLLVGETTDRPVAQAIAAALGPAPQVTVAPAQDMTALLGELADLDLVVATRFHNVVGALRSGVPTVAVVYAPKTREVMRALGQGRWCVAAAEVDARTLITLTDRLLADRAAVRHQLADATQDYADDVRRQFDAVAAELTGRPVPVLTGAVR